MDKYRTTTATGHSIATMTATPTRTQTHGQNAYSDDRRCRCDECRTAHRHTIAARRAAAYAHTAEHGLPPGVEHGTATAYDNWGCRCQTCRTASNARRRARRNRT